MSEDKFILDADGEPVECPDLLAWGRWMQLGDRSLGNTYVGDVRVSTVFLGLDYSFSFGSSPPVLWETMIFGGPHHMYQRRYSSRADALAGHLAAVAMARQDRGRLGSNGCRRLRRKLGRARGVSTLRTMIVGVCRFCHRLVSEADSWGSVGPMDRYPPRNPVHHMECRRGDW